MPVPLPGESAGANLIMHSSDLSLLDQLRSALGDTRKPARGPGDEIV